MSSRSWVMGLTLVMSCPGLADPVEEWGLEPVHLPPAATVSIDFETHIKPILERACLRCHGPDQPKSGFRLDNKEGALKGGDYGMAIVPNRSDISPLVHFAARLVEGMEMPPKKEEALSLEELALLRAWIDQDLHWPNEDRSQDFEPRFSYTPAFQFIEVEGDSNRFREHTGLQPGWSGGLRDFYFSQRLNEEEKLTLQGSFMAGQDEASLEFLYENASFGYVEGGFRQTQVYSDDTGGYYSGLTPPQFKLDRDLHMDFGKAWVVAGLEVPDWPKIRLGYEYLYRDGDKSLTQWGAMTNPSFQTRNVFPAVKTLEEEVHRIDLDLEHSLGGVEIRNGLTAEFYDNNNSRTLGSSFTPGAATADSFEIIRDDQEHWALANAFRLEKKIREDWMVSGGYLYSRLENETAFAREVTSPFFTATEPFSNQLSLDQDTHMFNLNTRLGPWKGLIFNAGLQNEWMNQQGIGTVVLRDFDRFPARKDSGLDRMAWVENLELRYDRIPLTVLYAEGVFRQERLDTYESSNDVFEGFMRDTDETMDQNEFRTGFHFAPWTQFRLNAYARHRERSNDYDHNRDETIFDPTGPGYSAFITEREVQEDSLVVRLSLRPWNGLKTTLGYQFLASDYTTQTGPYADAFAGVNIPAGRVLAGEYNAHVYSIHTSIQPWKRLLLSTSVSYHDTQLVSSVSNTPAVEPYDGALINLNTSATYILDKKTDLTGGIYFSHADYGQDHGATGLPLGLDYDWMQISGGIRRRIHETMTLRMDFVHYQYDEPWSGGLNDYHANGLFTSLMVHLP